MIIIIYNYLFFILPIIMLDLNLCNKNNLYYIEYNKNINVGGKSIGCTILKEKI